MRCLLNCFSIRSREALRFVRTSSSRVVRSQIRGNYSGGYLGGCSEGCSGGCSARTTCSARSACSACSYRARVAASRSRYSRYSKAFSLYK
ncbi:uncharacterized protein K452DRAFT_46285 [Aplosporella prunicola CBS 121167]|uniref:Uncharacterized protein n=1 Tax=Aplosporella prunicola CBS 121167 TaxID=1176127 RepID=A0A6A6AU64_9PEZI|nr:uncharacterized protein K452DRAFT_46285 [Aplosporella prunicola CBS 121167]KAF2135230.1 hypothetical protein K452DRAFT_46285 [Aplosporella prunicola CBS 121167]